MYLILQQIKVLIKKLLRVVGLLLIALLPNFYTIPTNFGEIFPATEIMVIYYLTCYTQAPIWLLCLLGVMTDQLTLCHLGTNALAYIMGYYMINLLAKGLLVQEYLTNLSIFLPYVSLVFALRYFTYRWLDGQVIELTPIIFQLLSTILAYPFFKPVINYCWRAKAYVKA